MAKVTLRQKSQGNRKLPKYLTTVTPLSKTIALILFILLPFLGFYFGRIYQQAIDAANQQVTQVIKPLPNIPTAIPHKLNLR